MLFNEIYGSYYSAVASILRDAVRGTLTEKKMYEHIRIFFRKYLHYNVIIHM